LPKILIIFAKKRAFAWFWVEAVQMDGKGSGWGSADGIFKVRPVCFLRGIFVKSGEKESPSPLHGTLKTGILAPAT
jgi:hypothetical protein